ncbi:MAG: alpha/beta hydrolase [Proteobacteria bacterium]|nr:alpha/beta hydrolase [Pseudomonadota bacterium]
MVKDKHTELTLMGRSLGSGVAIYVGAKREISRMILITPYDSIENVAKEIYWMFPIKFLIKDRYRSIDRATSIKAPVLMLVASMDRVIPRKHSMNLKSYFDPSQLTYLEFDGTGHNDIHLHPDYPNSIQNFISAQISVN